MKNIDGIYQSPTPSTKHSVAKAKSPAAKMRSYPQHAVGSCPFTNNPSMKTFAHASCPDDAKSFPARAQNMVTRGPVGGENTKGRSQM